MNNYKSQGQTFEQAGMNLDEGISVEDPLFKGCLNNLRKQQEEGFEIDMDAARTVVVAMEHDIAKVFEELRELVRKHEVKVVTKQKHPLIFKIADLADDPEEFKRLRSTLERNQQVEAMSGWTAPPMFIEAIPDANVVARAAADVMSELTALARKYKVQIYLGTKPALKTALYSLMYGAKKEDLDMSRLDEISVEKAIEMYERKLRKVAIVGGGGINGLVRRIIAEQHNLYSSHTWNFKDLANITKLGKPARDWEQSRLRRGKGHNKLKHKGKK